MSNPVKGFLIRAGWVFAFALIIVLIAGRSIP